MERIEQISHQLKASCTAAPATNKSPDDVVICFAARTPLTKSKRGKHILEKSPKSKQKESSNIPIAKLLAIKMITKALRIC
jgi:hypothetical protein